MRLCDINETTTGNRLQCESLFFSGGGTRRKTSVSNVSVTIIFLVLNNYYQKCLQHVLNVCRNPKCFFSYDRQRKITRENVTNLYIYIQGD